MREQRCSDGAHDPIVERMNGGVAAATSAILVLEAHDLPSMLIIDQTPPEATDAAGTGKRLWVIDKAEDVETDFDGEGREEIDFEPRSDDGREVSKLA